jgi:riboflavin biosynthesis pyrimidine reductase
VRLLLPSVRDLTDADLFELYDAPGPFLRAGFVASVDGAVAVDGRSRALGSPADLASFRALRATCDAVLVGGGTLRSEDYGPVRYGDQAAAWRADHGFAPQPPVVVVSRSGDLGSGRVLQGPVLLSGRDLPADLPGLVAALHTRGLTRLLCEGGPGLLTDLLRADLVDELFLTSSPQLVGDGPHLLAGLSAPVPLRLVSVVHDDPGVLLCRWSVVRSVGD